MIMNAGRVAKNHFAVVFVVASFSLAVATVQAGELHQAASRGDLAAVDALLVAGSVDLDNSDAVGTPLHHAIMGKHYRVARRLIRAGANLNVVEATLGTPLYLAVRQGDEAAARLLIAAGADLEAKGPLGTPLHLAAQHDLVNIVTLLLEKGAEIDARNREMATPLALAARKGGLDAAKVLLAKGADIEAKDVRDQTPLFYAVVGPNAVNVVPLLIQHGAKINVRDTAGITALTLAINRDRQPAIEILRAHGGVE
jgi:ankyrin repeat protein